MDISVVGCGRWGRNVIRTLLELEATEDVHLNDVVHTGNPNRARRIEDDLDVTPHTNLDEAVERNNAVCLVTPDETHPALTRKILRDRTNVFVEKPLAFSSDEVRKLFETADENDTLLMVGHLMLFHPVRSKLESHHGFHLPDLREVTVVRLSNLRDAGERRFPYSSLVHDISLLDALFETEPDNVTVQDAVGPYPPGRLLTARLTYNGTPVRLRARSDWPFPERTLTVRGETHDFRFDGLEETLTVLDRTGQSNATERLTFNRLPLTDELTNFVRACRGREPCAVTRQHVLRVTRALDELEDQILETLGARDPLTDAT